MMHGLANSKCRILVGVVVSFALDSVFQTEGRILGTQLWNLGIK